MRTITLLTLLLATSATSAADPGLKTGSRRRHHPRCTDVALRVRRADQAGGRKVHDLYAKAAAFEGADGTRLVLVTLDLGSVSERRSPGRSRRRSRRSSTSPGSRSC